MAIDVLTLTAILVTVFIAGVMVRICTLSENACSGPNEYLSRQRKQEQEDDEGAE
ncbi:MAG: hypothetical protein WBO34_00505 [Gammaproteobacteria bacterium]